MADFNLGEGWLLWKIEAARTNHASNGKIPCQIFGARVSQEDIVVFSVMHAIFYLPHPASCPPQRGKTNKGINAHRLTIAPATCPAGEMHGSK